MQDNNIIDNSSLNEIVDSIQIQQEQSQKKIDEFVKNLRLDFERQQREIAVMISAIADISDRDPDGQAKIQEQANAVAQKAVDGAQQMVKSAVDASTTVKKQSQEVADNLTQNSQKVQTSMWDKAGQMFDSIIQCTSDAASGLKSLGKSIINFVTGGDDNNKAAAEIRSTVDTNVKQMVQDNKTQAQAVVQSAQQQTTKLNSNTNTQVQQILDNANVQSKSIMDQAMGAASTLLGSNVAANVLTNLVNGNGFSTIPLPGVHGAVGEALSKVSSFLGMGSNPAPLVRNTLSTLSSDLAQGQNSVVGKIASAAGSVCSSLFSGAKSVVGSIADTVTDFAKSLFGSSEKSAENINKAAENTGKAATEQAGEAAKEQVDNAAKGGDAKGAAAEQAKKGSSGAEIAQGIANGVGDMVGKALGGGVLGSLASSLIKGAGGLIGKLFGDSEEAAKDAADKAKDAADKVDKKEEEAKKDNSGDENKEDNDENKDEQNDEPQFGQDSGQPAYPQGNASDDNGTLNVKQPENPIYGWNGVKVKWEEYEGLLGLMKDGDQQLFNPYGHPLGTWTTYSFRPEDSKKGYPMIAITPASFNALESMDTMLDNVPYVVIKEFFFKNTASTMINIIEKIKDAADNAWKSLKENLQNSNDKGRDKSSQGAADAKSTGNSITDKIKEIFCDQPNAKYVIDIPYLLYCCLRQKLYGNTYVFPYIVDAGGSTVINQANNQSEWGAGNNLIQNAIQGVTDMIGSGVATLFGMQAKPTTNLFPAPTWQPKNDDFVQFGFDLMLINDHFLKARNNYMCVNTIIHNNRSMQKAIMQFPGALYELWLPTGQRHLMCTCDLKLYPLGLNRKVPTNFFNGATGDNSDGANFAIGTTVGMGNTGSAKNPSSKLPTPHDENSEVLPDAYKLHLDFKSCLANNMNTSVFQYYVTMSAYSETGVNESPRETGIASMVDMFAGSPESSGETNAPVEPNQPTVGRSERSISEQFRSALTELVDDTDPVETFEEATYNKKLERLRSNIGDQAMNSDSVVYVIRKTTKAIRESNSFLSKLYNAENNKLWYKPFAKEEYYTTLKPDYQQILRKKYQDKFQELRSIDELIAKKQQELSDVETRLTHSQTLTERQGNIVSKVNVQAELNNLNVKRDDAVGEVLQVSTDMVQSAYDEHDDTISVIKNPITLTIFQQVWNEKIMNSYEKDKIQFMTSKEKERYFAEKIRELRSYDKDNVLKHPDWFFRVTVMDFIVSEMKRLLNWFKNCSFDDFETIYKIVRKLNLLHLDLERAKNDEIFNINKTNLFCLSEKDVKNFTKIDDLLNGNTLYELFSSQMDLGDVIQVEDNDTQKTESKPEKINELIVEQTSEVDTVNRRKMRDEVVSSVWGGESQLTKAAYDMANNPDSQDSNVTIINDDGTKTNMNFFDLKQRIIQLKISGETDNELKNLLDAFTQHITIIKENLVIREMNRIKMEQEKVMDEEDTSVNAPVTK